MQSDVDVVDHIAGCEVCHGHAPHWIAANALACAALHHKRTGHPTWARQTQLIRYGDARGPSGGQVQTKGQGSFF